MSFKVCDTCFCAIKRMEFKFCFSFVAFILLFKMNLTVHFQYPVFANQGIRFYLDNRFSTSCCNGFEFSC